MHYFCLYSGEGSVRIGVQINSRKAHRPSVPHDVDERDAAGPALRCVHPVPGPGIHDRVPLAPIPDIETVERVERNRQPDPKQLKEEYERKISEKAYLPGVSVRPADGGRVRNQNMFEQERAHWHDAGKRMQAAQKKRRTLSRAQRRHPLHRTVTCTWSSRTGC